MTKLNEIFGFGKPSMPDTSIPYETIMTMKYSDKKDMAKLLKDDDEAATSLSKNMQFKKASNVMINVKTRSSIKIPGIKLPTSATIEMLKALGNGYISDLGVSMYGIPLYQVTFGNKKFDIFEPHLIKLTDKMIA